eukprot:gb/GECH01007658.1/.p1 GENE.gb/GECH01007658.1/~~gb/GECH01007658.1/.p1  ORF type:complete len:178 (+),score=33.27 gb/GECH01007658.1/:1-534(+)
MHNNSITGINLFGNLIDDKGCAWLSEVIGSKNCSLSFLRLRINHISDQGCKIMSDALIHNHSLTNLDMNANFIRDEGCMFLADALIHNKSLKYLNLEKNKIGERGFRKLDKCLKENNSLLKIEVEDPNHFLSETGYRQLRVNQQIINNPLFRDQIETLWNQNLNLNRYIYCHDIDYQ